MACKIERPDQRVLFESIKSMFSTNVLGGAPIIPESNEHYVVSNDYAMAEMFYSVCDQAWRERDPRYCCAENLIDMAALDGIYPEPASYASGYVRLTGNALAPLPTQIEFTFGGLQFISVGRVPSSINAQGWANVQVRALEPGEDGNLNSSVQTGTLNTTIANVNTTVSVYGSRFCGGKAAESTDEFRTRYLERKKYVPEFYLQKAIDKLMEWPCVTSVCERSGTCCYDDQQLDYQGGVACARPIRLYALFDNTFEGGAADETTIANINEWLFGFVQGVGQGQVPWGVTGQVFQHDFAYIDVEIDGMACTSPATTDEIRARISEFIARLCPSQILYAQDLRAIISQIMAGTGNYDIILESTDTSKVVIDTGCGDAIPNCDVRILLREIRFPNPGE